MTYAFLAFTIGLFIGHQWALYGMKHNIDEIENMFEAYRREYKEALESAELAERAYKKAAQELDKLKKELEDSIK